jgi:succinate-acetate transporter protein
MQCGTLRAVNAFHVCGILFACWALTVSFLGIRFENFPSNDGAARVVGVISVLLAAAAIGTAIYTSATEEEEGEEGGEEQALVVRV